MTSRTLLRKAAGNIKKDLKNSRSVLTVNESEMPENSITSFKERAYKSAYSYPTTINEVDRKMLYDYYYNKTTKNLYTLPNSEFSDSLAWDGKFKLDLIGTKEYLTKEGLTKEGLTKEDLTKLYESLPKESVNFINKGIIRDLFRFNDYTLKDIPKKYGGENTSPKSDKYKDTEYLIKKDIPDSTMYFIKIQQKILNHKMSKYKLEAERDAIKSYKTNSYFRYIANPELERTYKIIVQLLENEYDNV